LLKKRYASLYILGALAVTTKALCFVPLAAMVLAGPVWSHFKDRRDLKKILLHAFALGLTLVPFVLWLWTLKAQEIPNPFFKTIASEELRHTGSWLLLLDVSYWSRFVTWNFVKGAGLVASLVLCWALIHRFRSEENSVYPLPLLGILGALIPYWLLIREGNFIHDYYSLAFVVSIMIFAALVLSQKRSFLSYAVLPFLSMLLGLAQIYSLSKGQRSSPDFCHAEVSRSR
jgi:hypothetical protein